MTSFSFYQSTRKFIILPSLSVLFKTMKILISFKRSRYLATITTVPSQNNIYLRLLRQKIDKIDKYQIIFKRNFHYFYLDTEKTFFLEYIRY